MLEKDGVDVDPNKIQAMLASPKPQTLKGFRVSLVSPSTTASSFNITVSLLGS
jgi:hypothetical protein